MNNPLIKHEDRVLPFVGVFNFRDMGGYQTVDGRTVKYGLLYRSAELTGMTEQDKVHFQTLGIKTIFDYRDDGEASDKPDPSFPGVNHVRIPAMRSETTMDMRDLIKSDYFVHITPELFANMYVQMAFDSPSFKELMRIFANTEQAGLLHHCAGGRDRTGIGAAYMLLALGVDRETIMSDYLLSNELLLPMYEQMKEQWKGNISVEEMEQSIAKLALQRQFLQAVFDKIDADYSSVDQFLEQQFGLTADKLAEIRQFYLY